MATLRIFHDTLRHAISSAAIPLISEFRPQGIANTAWSLAKLECFDGPLIHSLAAESLPRLSEFKAVELGNTAWSFAKIQYHDDPCFGIVLAAERTVCHQSEPSAVEMMLWALGQLDNFSLIWPILEHAEILGLQASGVGMASVLAVCERRGRVVEEKRLWNILASGPSGAAASSALALRCLELGDAECAVESLRSAARQGTFTLLSAQLWRAAVGGTPPMEVHTGLRPLAPQHAGHAKELKLLAFVLATAERGRPASVCEAVERFAESTIREAGMWLKVAAGGKAQVLASGALSAPAGGVVLEMGTYCGYSSLRISMARPDLRVVSLEANAVYAAIARCVIAFGGLAHAIDVRLGHSADSLPHLFPLTVENARSPPLAFVFMDQCGSRFLTDLSMLEDRGWLQDGAVVVADNVLKPGSPDFLWYTTRSGVYSTSIVRLEEFAMPGAEDWMSISTYHGIHQRSHIEALPHALQALQREADRIRIRAAGQSGSVKFEEWAHFARWMKRGLAEEGIVPDLAVGEDGLQPVTD